MLKTPENTERSRLRDFTKDFSWRHMSRRNSCLGLSVLLISVFPAKLKARGKRCEQWTFRANCVYPMKEIKAETVAHKIQFKFEKKFVSVFGCKSFLVSQAVSGDAQMKLFNLSWQNFQVQTVCDSSDSGEKARRGFCHLLTFLIGTKQVLLRWRRVQSGDNSGSCIWFAVLLFTPPDRPWYLPQQFLCLIKTHSRHTKVSSKKLSRIRKKDVEETNLDSRLF